MIEIQLYRRRVGIFSGGKHHLKSIYIIIFLWITVSVSLLVVLTAELNLHHFNVVITRRLKLSDVELNPGLYEIIRSVQASFYQGNVVIFGETAGRLCACNALFSIC